MQAPTPPLLSRGEKIRLFLAGFVGWFVVNGVLNVLAAWLSSTGNQIAQYAAVILGLALFAANIVGLLVLAFFPRGRWVAFGILAAIGVVLTILIIVGVIVAAVCFSSNLTH